MKMLSGAIVVLAGAVICGGAAVGAGDKSLAEGAFGLGVFLGLGGLVLMLVFGIQESSARGASTQGQAALPSVQPLLQPGVRPGIQRADQERQQ